MSAWPTRLCRATNRRTDQAKDNRKGVSQVASHAGQWPTTIITIQLVLLRYPAFVFRAAVFFGGQYLWTSHLLRIDHGCAVVGNKVFGSGDVLIVGPAPAMDGL
jgi:hypothetical protein